MHLDEVAVGAFEIRSGDVDVRAREMAGVNFAFEVQVGVGLDAAGRAHGGHTAGKIKTRSGERHLWDEHRFVVVPAAVEVGSRHVEKVIVHADDSRDHGVALEIEHGGVLRRSDVGSRLDRRNLASLEHDVLIVRGGAAGSVDDANVGEDYFCALHADILLDFFREIGGLLRVGERDEEKCGSDSNASTHW